jgi:hypothetical protein
MRIQKIGLNRRILTISAVLFIVIIGVSEIAFGHELTQTIKGRVIDKANRNPLSGANVVVKGTDPLMGNATDSEGYFRIEGVPIGRYNIQVTYLGYKAAVIPEVMVGSGKEVVLNIELEETVQNMQEIVVRPEIRKDKSQNNMASVSARRFTVEETRRYAGGLDDPARMVSAFSGVTVGNPQDNAIVIRGNAPKGVLWRLEGIDIPTPSHFPGGNIAGGGFVSIISNQLLSNSDFYTGAFPAEYGNALAGVFDIQLREGNRDKREFTFQAGVLGIDVSAEGPFVKDKKATYLFNYRYSTFGLLKDINVLPTEQIPEYQDLSFKLNFPTKNAGVFSLWGVGGNDLNIEPEENDSTKWETTWDRVNYDFKAKMGALGLNHKYIFGEKAYLNSTLALTGKDSDMDMRRLDDDLKLRPVYLVDDNSAKLSLHSFLNYKFNARHTNKTGVYYKTLFFNQKLAGATIEQKPETFRQFVDEEGTGHLTQVYTQSKYKFNSDLNMTLGINAEYFDINEEFNLNPRLGLNWQFQPGHSFSLGYGKHTQPEPLKIYFIDHTDDNSLSYPNKDLKLSQAHHIVLGYDWMINKNLRLKIEPYYQYLYDIPGIADSSYSMINFKQDFALRDNLQNNTQAYNYGVDFTLERFLKNNYYYLVTASLFSSKYQAANGETYSTRWDKQYVLNILFGKEFIIGKSGNNILGVNGRLNLIGGERYSPVLRQISHLEERVVYDHSSAFSQQFEAMRYLDVSLSYRINKQKYSSVLSLQVKNILGTPLNEGFKYNYKTDKVEESKIYVVLPVISYKIEF